MKKPASLIGNKNKFLILGCGFSGSYFAETIKKFSKLASIGSKTLLPTTKNTTISFTFGNWALPYLKLLKKIGIAQ